MLRDRLPDDLQQDPIGGDVTPGAALAAAERWQAEHRPHWTPYTWHVTRRSDGSGFAVEFFDAADPDREGELLGTVDVGRDGCVVGEL